MTRNVSKTGTGLVVLLALAACASQEEPSEVTAEAVKQCRPNETLTCDEFAGEAHNCTCEQGDNLRDMLDAYRTPDY